MLDAPGRRLGDAEVALKFQGTDGVLLLGQEVQGQKPRGQWQLDVVEDRADGQRGLVATVPAPKQPRVFTSV